MSVGYSLVNHTRGELILFAHISASTKREITGNPVAASIIAWYMLEHAGDLIAFVSDSCGEWPFPTGARRDLESYRECTDEVVESLLAEGILVDDGDETYDPNDAEVFNRKLRNVWLER
jgi:hypothetical protein